MKISRFDDNWLFNRRQMKISCSLNKLKMEHDDYFSDTSMKPKYQIPYIDKLNKPYIYAPAKLNSIELPTKIENQYGLKQIGN